MERGGDLAKQVVQEVVLALVSVLISAWTEQRPQRENQEQVLVVPITKEISLQITVGCR